MAAKFDDLPFDSEVFDTGEESSTNEFKGGYGRGIPRRQKPSRKR